MKQISQTQTRGIDVLAEFGPILPVLSLRSVEQGLGVIQALSKAGFKAVEITMRDESALTLLSEAKVAFPELFVGAGTVVHSKQLDDLNEVDFVVTPGVSDHLLEALIDSGVPFLPGISTASDIVRCMERGVTVMKFFPAELSGGVAALNAFKGPFKEARFCPTGGVNEDSMRGYLAADNVVMVGGTWLAPEHLIASEDWDGIEALAQRSLANVQDVIR